MLNVFRDGIADEAETIDPELRRERALETLRSQLASVAERSEFHRERFARAGFDPKDPGWLAGFGELPLMSKRDHLESLAARRPWGTNLAVDPDEVVRVHFSSGTTSEPTPIAWTAADLERWTHMYARCAYGFGLRHTDVYQCLLSFAWFVGGLGTHAAFERVGATCIPGGNQDSLRQLRTMERFGTTFIALTPSFAIHLAEVADQNGIDLRALPVNKMLIAGEPGGSVPATRRMIEELWNAKVFDGYGSLEFQPIAWECDRQAGLHLAEDFLYPEVLDPETLRPVPDGTPGLLVLTHLDKQAHPLVRWSTGDVVSLDRGRCECGRTTARLAGGVLGRTDDMLVVRGVNLFPSAVEDVVRSLPELNGEYQVIVDDEVRDPRSGHLNAIKVTAEATADPCPPGVAGELATRIRATLTVRALVEVVPPGTLQRSTHKARRLIRR